MKVNNPLKIQGRKKLEEQFNGIYYYRVSFQENIKEHNQRYGDFARLYFPIGGNTFKIIYE